MEFLELDRERIEMFWKLYVCSCESTHTSPDMGDFHLWYYENYGEGLDD